MKSLIAAVALVAAFASTARAETSVYADHRLSEGGAMVLGCAVGAAAGAMVGTVPVITLWGAVVAPYTVPQAAFFGCVVGTAASAVGSKLANTAAAYYWR